MATDDHIFTKGTFCFGLCEKTTVPSEKQYTFTEIQRAEVLLKMP